MTPTAREDLTLPLIPERAQNSHGPVPTSAYVPIAIAIVGVILVLVGGIQARSTTTPSEATIPVYVSSAG
jgi:hypothetical protein